MIKATVVLYVDDSIPKRAINDLRVNMQAMQRRNEQIFAVMYSILLNSLFHSPQEVVAEISNEA